MNSRLIKKICQFSLPQNVCTHAYLNLDMLSDKNPNYCMQNQFSLHKNVFILLTLRSCFISKCNISTDASNIS